jgi:hypothetical protein
MLISLITYEITTVVDHCPPDRKTTLVPVYLFLILPVVDKQPHRLLAVRFTL